MKKREEIIQGITGMAGFIFLTFAGGCLDCDGFGWALFYAAMAVVSFLAAWMIEVKNA